MLRQETSSPDWEAVVIEAVTFALRHGSSTVSRASARPEVAEQRARSYLRALGREDALVYEPMSDGGVRLISAEPAA